MYLVRRQRAAVDMTAIWKVRVIQFFSSTMRVENTVRAYEERNPV